MAALYGPPSSFSWAGEGREWECECVRCGGAWCDGLGRGAKGALAGLYRLGRPELWAGSGEAACRREA